MENAGKPVGMYDVEPRQVVNAMAQQTIQDVLKGENDAHKWENEAKEQAASIVEQAKEDEKELLKASEKQAIT